MEARIAQDRYERMTGAYRTELAAVETRLHRAWAVLPVDGRHLLVGSIWPEGVLYDGQGYRTGPVNPVLHLLKGKNVGGYVKQKTGHPALFSPNVPSSDEREPLIESLDAVFGPGVLGKLVAHLAQIYRLKGLLTA